MFELFNATQVRSPCLVQTLLTNPKKINKTFIIRTNWSRECVNVLWLCCCPNSSSSIKSGHTNIHFLHFILPTKSNIANESSLLVFNNVNLMVLPGRCVYWLHDNQIGRCNNSLNTEKLIWQTMFIADSEFYVQ